MSIAKISWIQRKFAQALFDKPPVATYEEALLHFNRAESISPGFWKKNMVMIAECKLHLKQPEVAREWLVRALQLPIISEEDEESHTQAKVLLKSL